MHAGAGPAEYVVFAVIERHAKPQNAIDNCARGRVRSRLSAVFLHCTVDPNLALREAAIRHCRLLSQRWGDAVPASELTRGFTAGDRQVKLVHWGRGIFKPEELTDGPLTLVSSLTSRYEDKRLEGDMLLYDYASKAFEWANEGLKKLKQLGRPVILLEQVKKKPNPEYMIFAPVSILDFDDHARTFRLGLIEAQVDAPGLAAVPTPGAFVKAYAKTMVQARLHQARFRKDTLTAYADQCAICELRERPLLDAAHIMPDRLPDSVPEVRNGLAMCPTHHRAFDQDFLTITEQYKVVVQRERLRHLHSAATARMLLDFDQRTIVLPRDRGSWPAPEFLRRRVELGAW